MREVADMGELVSEEPEPVSREPGLVGAAVRVAGERALLVIDEAGSAASSQSSNVKRQIGGCALSLAKDHPLAAQPGLLTTRH